MRRSIGLRTRFLLCLALLSVFCFTATGAVTLAEAARHQQARLRLLATLIAHEIALQANQHGWNVSPAAAPVDPQSLAPMLGQPGDCITLAYPLGAPRQSFCAGQDLASHPPWLVARLGALLLGPPPVARASVAGHAGSVGQVVVAPDASAWLGAIWAETAPTMAALGLALIALIALFAIALQALLRPTHIIRHALQRLAENDFSARLPAFDFGELSAISAVFNHLAETLAAIRSERDALLRRLVTAQEDERRQLAADLHDELGQCLAAISARVAAIRLAATTACATLLPDCDATLGVIDRVMLALRGLLLRLRPLDLDALGLAESLRALVTTWNGGLGPRLRLRIDGNPATLPPSVSTALYRVTQEAITNAVRHGQASQVSVTLSLHGDNQVTLAIEDDGTLTPPDLARPGLGIAGMRERLAALGGTLRLVPLRPSGLRVLGTVAINPVPLPRP